MKLFKFTSVTSIHWAACLLAFLVMSQAQETAAETKPDQAALHAKFKAMLDNSVFNGQWSIIKEGKPTPGRPETYRIQSATHIQGDQWAITARIQYGTKDISVPVPINVYWAKDTPVISLTNLMIPGLGTYTARVLVHEDTYAGSWSGGEVTGLLSGSITRAAKE